MSPAIQAVILGILEGLTEFLPVSSTGHLILLAKAISFRVSHEDTFAIFIQLGAILAVIVLYTDRFKSLFNFSGGTGFSGRKGISKLFAASLPAFILGFLLHGFIKRTLFSPYVVAWSFILGGIVLVVIERFKLSNKTKAIEDLSLSQCFKIGLFQCLALIPGVSRSGSTIVGAMLVGVEKKVAAEFSFLVAVPVMCAAVGYDVLKSIHSLANIDLSVFAVGFIVSFITAILAIKFLLALLQRWTLAPFGIYRIVLGLVVLWLL